MGRRKKKKKKEKGEMRERGERSSNFSLRFTEIGGSVFVGPKTKDHLLNKGYAWLSKTRDFVEDSSEEFGKGFEFRKCPRDFLKKLLRFKR